MSSPCEFATLTPANVPAKLAFSEAYESSIQDPTAAYKQHMFATATERKYDRDVFLYRFKQQQKQLYSLSRGNDDDATSQSSTEPNSDNERESGYLGMIWTGCYLFDLEALPRRPQAGWTAGRDGVKVDFLITTNQHYAEIKSSHVLFNFHRDTGYLYIISRASSASAGQVTVNGHNVDRGEMQALNQSPMTIRLGPLEYVFDYTETARSNTFYHRRGAHMKKHLNIAKSDFSLTPTPAGQTRTIGSWTLGRSLGKGGFGKVYSATNSKNHIVAIKMVERGSKKAMVDNEIQVLEELKRLAERENDEGRLLHLKEVIYRNGEPEYNSTLFEDVALVLEPAVQGTFEQLTEAAEHRRPSRSLDVITAEATKLFHDTLQGVRFLHFNGWLHGDIKPGNIGINGDRAVLLDIGGAQRFHSRQLVPPTPGHGGTVFYLSPEREMQPYGSEVDVWAMGVILYELIFGYHPWKSAVNPWRPGHVYESLRPKFHEQYCEAMDRIRHSKAKKAPKIVELLIPMLSHQWAEGNNERRISVNSALEHPCWHLQESEEPAAKKKRLSAA